LGPVYGFQWRHFGAQYQDMHASYEGKGVDQLAECIRQIKEDPNSRRIVLSAWNPADLPEMALPPCHMFCQFYVRGRVLCFAPRDATRVDDVRTNPPTPSPLTPSTRSPLTPSTR